MIGIILILDLKSSIILPLFFIFIFTPHNHDLTKKKEVLKPLYSSIINKLFNYFLLLFRLTSSGLARNIDE